MTKRCWVAGPLYMREAILHRVTQYYTTDMDGNVLGSCEVTQSRGPTGEETWTVSDPATGRGATAIGVAADPHGAERLAMKYLNVCAIEC